MLTANALNVTCKLTRIRLILFKALESTALVRYRIVYPFAPYNPLKTNDILERVAQVLPALPDVGA